MIEREEIAARASRRGEPARAGGQGSRAASSKLTRERVRDHEDRRDRLQADVNRLHREHVDRRAELDAAQARKADAARRLSQLETGTCGRARRARAHRNGTARGARPHGNRHRCLGGARTAARGARAGARAAARPSSPLRARRRRRRSSGRASWRCRWSRGAPRMPRSSTTLTRVEKQLEDLAQRRDGLLDSNWRTARRRSPAQLATLEQALADARADRGRAAGRKDCQR